MALPPQLLAAAASWWAAAPPPSALPDFLHPDATRRIAAVERAGRSQKPLYLEPLINRLRQDPDEDVRTAAATALGDLGVPKTAGDLTRLLDALAQRTRSPDRKVATAAIRALGRYPFPAAQRALTALLDARGPALRAAARTALSTSDQTEDEARMGAWLRLERSEGRRMASDTPAPLPEGIRWQSEDPIEWAMRDLLAPDPARQASAVRTLARAPLSASTHRYLQYAFAEGHPKARRAAVAAMTTWPETRRAAPLIAALRSDDPVIREHAIDGLAGLHRPDVADALLAALQNEKDRALVPRLMQSLATLAPDPIGRALARRLATLSDDKLAIRLLGALGKETYAWSPAGAATIASELYGRGGPATRRRAARFLDQPPPKIRSAALRDAIDRSLSVPTATAATNDASVRPADRRDRATAANAPPTSDPRASKQSASKQRASDRRARDRWLTALARGRGPATPDLHSDDALRWLDHGIVHPAIAALIKNHPDATRIPALIARLDHPKASVRRVAARLLEGYATRADVRAAVPKAYRRHPEDAALRRRLLEQAPSIAVPPLLERLQSAAPISEKKRILTALSDRPHPDIAPVVGPLVRAEPALFDPALDAVAGQTEGAYRALRDWAQPQSGLPAEQRRQAVHAMARTPRPGVTVEADLLALSADADAGVRFEARNALHEVDPALYPSWDPHGRYPLIAEGALFGANFLMLSNQLRGRRLSPAFVGGAGLILGGITPYLLTQNEEITVGQAAYFGTTGLWGTLGGWGLGAALHESDSATRWWTLGGEALGVTLGALTLKQSEWGIEDAMLTHFAAAEAGLLAVALHRLRHERRPRRLHATGLIAGAAVSVPVGLWSRRLRLRNRATVFATTMAHGTYLGLLTPGLLKKRDATWAGLLLGQSAGFFAGLAWSQLGDIRKDQALFSALGAAWGGLSFGGLAWRIDPHPGPLHHGLVGGGALAGAILAGALGPKLSLRGNDPYLVLIGALAGASAGGELSVRAEEDRLDEVGFPAGLVLGAGAGALGGILLAQATDVSDRALRHSLLGGGLFLAGGLGAGHYFDLSARGRSRLSGLAAAAGFGLGLGFGDALRFDRGDQNFIAVAAGFGLAHGAIAAGYRDDAPWTAGAALGASVGALSAAAAAQSLRFEDAQIATLVAQSIAASGLAWGVTGLAGASGRGRRLVVQGAGLSALGLGAAWIGWPRTTPLLPDARWLDEGALLGAHGLVHGAALPTLWDAAPAAELVAAGAVAGASLGFMAGALDAAAAPERAFDKLGEGSLWGLSGYGLSAGLGLLDRSDRTAGIALNTIGLGALAGGWLAAPATRFDTRDPLVIAHGAASLGWLGSQLAPAIEDAPTDGQRAGGIIAGASLGAALGAMRAQYVDGADGRDEAELFSWTLAGAALGLGTTGALGQNDRWEAAGHLAGGLLGLGTGLVAVPHTAFDLGRATFAGALATWGASQGFLVAHGQSERPTGATRRRWTALGGGAGLAAGLGLSQALRPRAVDVAEASLTAALLGTAGYGLSGAFTDDRRPAAAATQAGLLLGAAVGGIAAPHTRFNADDVWLGGLLGAQAAYHAAWIAHAREDARPQRARATTGGAALGIVTGAALGQLNLWRPSDLGEATLLSLAAHSIGGGLAAWRSQDVAGASAFVHTAGAAGLVAGLALSPHLDLREADLPLLGFGGLVGLWHGAWCPAFDEATSAPKHHGGGALLGMSAGLLASTALGFATDVAPSNLLESAGTWLAFSSIGGGIAQLSETNPAARGAWLQSSGLAGLVLGAALSPHLHFDAGDRGLVALGLGAGAAIGLTLPTWIGDHDHPLDRDGALRQRTGGALLGAGLGVVAAGAIAQAVTLDRDEVLEIGGYGALGAALGLGFDALRGASHARRRVASIDLGAIAGLGLGVLAAPHTEFSDAASTHALTFAALGAAGGASLAVFDAGPDARDVRAAQLGGGALFGAGLGVATGLILDQSTAIDPEDDRAVALGATVGALSGTGLGLLTARDDRVAALLGPAAAGAAAIGLGLTHKDLYVSAADLGKGTAWVSYLSWHSLGLSLLLDGTDRQAAGVAMSTVGLGALAGMYLMPRLHFDTTKTLMWLAGSAWGAWIGGWSAAMIREQLRDAPEGRRRTGLSLVGTVLGSDLGLLLTGLATEQLVDVSPERFAHINLAGGVGLMSGMLLSGFLNQGQPLQEGNVIGSIAGLAAGAVITSFIDYEAPRGWGRVLGPPTASNPIDRSGAGGLLHIDQWYPSAGMQPGPGGEERYLFQISGTWH